MTSGWFTTPISHHQAIGLSKLMTTSWPIPCSQAAVRPLVCLSGSTLNRNSYPQSPVRYIWLLLISDHGDLSMLTLLDCQPHLILLTTRSYFTDLDFIRPQWCHPYVDQFLPRQPPHSVCPLFRIQVDSSTCVVWSSTGVGLQADALPHTADLVQLVETEVLWFASARCQTQLPSDSLAVGSALTCCHLSHICDLSIYIDADLTKKNVNLYSTSSSMTVLHTSNVFSSLNWAARPPKPPLTACTHGIHAMAWQPATGSTSQQEVSTFVTHN